MHELDQELIEKGVMRLKEPHPNQAQIDATSVQLLQSGLSRDEFTLVQEAVQASPVYETYGPELDLALRSLGFDCPICGRTEPHECEETLR